MDTLVFQFPIISSLFIVAVFFLFYKYLVPQKQQIDEFFYAITDESRRNKWKRIEKNSPIVKLFHSFLLLFGYYFWNWKTKGWRQTIEKRLLMSGYPGALTFETYCGMISFGAILGFCLGMYAGLSLFHEINPPIMFLMVGLCTYLPIMWLNEQVTKRKWGIAKELPYKIDLMILSVEAGMDLQSAIENVVDRGSDESPLREEFFTMLQEIRMGKTRKTAMKDMAARVEIDAVDSLVGNIIQGEMMGTPIGHILKVQAEMMRVQRTNRAEKLAGEAPVKMIFPLLFIFTSVFLVLFGSMIVRYVRGEFAI